ncbi:MAG: hypothetical protein HY684_05370 [Chloroflexi bacterium]|nr:hypothetical protein [Chloroflexota bacterium]
MQDDCITIALGLPEVRVLREEEATEAFTVEVIYRTRSAACPRCGLGTPKVHDVRVQRKRDRRLWDKPVFPLLHKRGGPAAGPVERSLPSRKPGNSPPSFGWAGKAID